jgi:hypothetical protein
MSIVSRICDVRNLADPLSKQFASIETTRENILICVETIGNGELSAKQQAIAITPYFLYYAYNNDPESHGLNRKIPLPRISNVERHKTRSGYDQIQFLDMDENSIISFEFSASYIFEKFLEEFGKVGFSVDSISSGSKKITLDPNNCGYYPKQLSSMARRITDRLPVELYDPDLGNPQRLEHMDNPPALYAEIKKEMIKTLPKHGLFGLSYNIREMNPATLIFISMAHLPVINSENPFQQFNSFYGDYRRNHECFSGTQDAIFEELCKRITNQKDVSRLGQMRIHLPVPRANSLERNMTTPNWMTLVACYGYVEAYVHVIVRQFDDCYWITGGETINLYA